MIEIQKNLTFFNILNRFLKIIIKNVYLQYMHLDTVKKGEQTKKIGEK